MLVMESGVMCSDQDPNLPQHDLSMWTEYGHIHHKVSNKNDTDVHVSGNDFIMIKIVQQISIPPARHEVAPD